MSSTKTMTMLGGREEASARAFAKPMTTMFARSVKTGRTNDRADGFIEILLRGYIKCVGAMLTPVARSCRIRCASGVLAYHDPGGEAVMRVGRRRLSQSFQLAEALE